MLPIGIDLGGGRRLRHATAELVERRTDDAGNVQLTFATEVGEPFEVALEGSVAELALAGGERIVGHPDAADAVVFVVEPTGTEVALMVGAARG